MAVVPESFHIGGGTATAAPTASSVAGGTDQDYLVAVATRAATNPDVSSIDFGGLTFEWLASIVAGDDQFDIHLWEAFGSPSTGTLTVNLDGTAGTVSICVLRSSGCDPSGPTEDVTTAFGVDAAANQVELTSTRDGSLHVAFPCPRSTTYLTNPADAAYTRQGNADFGAGGERVNLYCETLAMPSAGIDEWNGAPSAANDWAAIGVVLRPPIVEAPPAAAGRRLLMGIGI